MLILEREKFPRDHIGESLLPAINPVLVEMGVWDKIEAADFPVKIGATYRWGKTDELWDFDFLPGQGYDDPPRPAKYEGQRVNTAFQVDRAIYDKILMDHAREHEVEVREETKVAEILHEGDRITGFKLADGSVVTARHYIDASGNSGIVRRAMDVEAVEPSMLRNIAVWYYWQNTDWAVNIGVSGTRIQVRSLGWGWIWFIPIGPTRTSIGLVMPAEYYKQSGKKMEDLYFEAMDAEPGIKKLLANATCEPKQYTTKDWSFVSKRMYGDNWFLVGEAAGFADPILSAGVTLAHVGARQLCSTILELDKGNLDAEWLKSEFERRQTRRVRTHIQFADYWYSANEHFSELIENVSNIADAAGYSLDGKSAWQWLGTGGFVDVDSGDSGVGGFTLASVTWLVKDFTGEMPQWNCSKNNRFKLNLEGAEEVGLALYRNGAIERVPGFKRGNRVLPGYGVYRFFVDVLGQTDRIDAILEQVFNVWCTLPGRTVNEFPRTVRVLEAMINDGWVEARYDPNLPLLNLAEIIEEPNIHKNIDTFDQQPALEA